MKELLRDIRISYGADKAKQCEDVIVVIRSKVLAKNLYGWRWWLDEVLEDVVAHMIRTEFSYSGGAYVACGMQGAVDKCRYCNAKKRKPNYDTVSLDLFYQVPDTTPNDAESTYDLLMAISSQFGDELAKQLEPFLLGYVDQLEKKVLDRVKEPDFANWFAEYSKH